ncbi:MAG: tetratricopeptide repeat protein [Spirochaetales bacterium]|nr:tetratricopeptide repeat protein [Spirochaetales bacterium]MCF7939070.1 tetratricopeptide repeat protein [Spirochaetales bacterium]
MYGSFPIAILIIVPVAVLGLFIFFFLKKNQEKDGENRRKKAKDSGAVLKEANRKLAQNPKDHEALSIVADHYYQQEEWSKAFNTYKTLLDLCATNPDIDEFQVNLRYGLTAMKTKQYEEAYKSLMIARKENENLFEINYNLGYLEYLRKNYDRASALLNRANKSQPDHFQTMKYLAQSLYRMRKHSDAVRLLKQVVDVMPDDKEALFTLGQAYHDLGQGDNALKVFTHLRGDPRVGPNASLFAGTIHANQRQYERAIMDYEIGLKHEQIKPAVQLELKYRLAMAYIQNQDISNALQYLHQIKSASSGYKDVESLIKRYQELNSNNNLRIYLMSQTSDFVSLCRKIVTHHFRKASVKISDISVQKSEYADILAEVDTPSWQDLVLFRFIRSSSTIGELSLRDFHSRVKEVKAGRGLCMTPGTFSEEAKRFVEARLIDLIEKDKFNKILQAIS